MERTLRKYQKECLEVISGHFENNGRQLIQLPTGSGKTLVFLNYLKAHSKRAWIVCPSIDLKDQILRDAKIILKDRIVTTELAECDSNFVYISTVQGVSRKLGRKWDIDTLIIDEAHHAQAKTYRLLIENFKEAKILGLTATPERKDGKSLIELFGAITYKKNILDLIEAGFLCDIEAHRIRTDIDLPNSKFNRGDFSNSVLKSLDDESRNRLIYDTYFKYCRGKKTLIFCINIDHAIKVGMYFDKMGLKAASIHGDLFPESRKIILRKFKSGEFDILTNCQLLTEGFDEPSIEAIIIARPTRSKALYCQMVGRGTRLHPGKEHCYLYELTDNNHKICTFSTLGGREPGNDYDYVPGTKLTELKKELINIDNIETSIEKINLFNSSYLSDFGAFDHQLNQLEGEFLDTLSYKEAAFLIWFEKLKEKYGYDRKKG